MRGWVRVVRDDSNADGRVRGARMRDIGDAKTRGKAHGGNDARVSGEA